MKALFFQDNKLQFRSDFPDPVPCENEALIRVIYAGICSTDLELVKGYMNFDGILGHEFVGIIEKCTDKDLIGKRVSGEINISCQKCSYCNSGMERHCPNRSVLGILGRDGAFAELLTLPTRNLHLIPDSISDDEALFIEPVAAAFEILEQLPVSHGDKVCLIGDGRLGILTAQVLASTGCQLLVMGKHEEKLAILQSKGIKTKVISAPCPTLSSELKNSFHIVVDCTGSPEGIESAMKLVRSGGTIVLKTTVAGERRLDLNELVIDEITLIGSRCGPFEPAIKAIEGKVVNVKQLISKVFTLDDGINAFDFAAKKGVLKVLLKMS